jgi:exodeoxyribonuclease V gamma subunit
VGDRLVTALLAGGDIEAVCAAEVARGLLPPGALGHEALALARIRAEAIAEAARLVADGVPTSLEVDVELGGGRRLVGTVPGVVGSVVRATAMSRLGPKHQIGAWVRFLAATASHPHLPLSGAVIGREKDGARTILLGRLAGTAEGRAERAGKLLEVLVDLRDRGRREPLPLYTETSARYAAAVRAGREHPEDEAERCWTSEYEWEREDRDGAHVLVNGGIRSFGDVLAEPPAEDEAGPGWPMSEPTRFGRLARRLWDPVLDASGGRRA